MGCNFGFSYGGLDERRKQTAIKSSHITKLNDTYNNIPLQSLSWPPNWVQCPSKIRLAPSYLYSAHQSACIFY